MAATKLSKSMKYDLEDRTFLFAQNCRKFVHALPRTIQSIEDAKQLVRSSGSVAANYIEANESLSRKDYTMRVKVCRKEAKESILWLKLLGEEGALIKEVTELMKIFGAIIEKVRS